MFWMLVFSCMGPSADTLVDELRVMGIQFEPAEIRLQDFFPDQDGVVTPPMVNVVIGDPNTTGYQMAIWPCTNLGEGCQELDVFKDNPEDWITLVEGTDTLVSVPVITNPIWSIFAQSREPVFVTSLFVLVCEPSMCPSLQAAFSDDWDLNAFSNPFDLVAELPLVGTSMAIKQIPVSNGVATDPRLQNPIVEPMFETLEVEAEGDIELNFTITLFQQDPDVASIFGYTTLGGFNRNVFASNGLQMATNEATEKSVTWYGGTEDSGSAELFVVVEDGAGGTGLWIGNGTVIEK